MPLEEQGSRVGPVACGGGSLSCLQESGRCCPCSQGLVSAHLSASFAREKGMTSRTWISPSGLQYGDAGDASAPVMLILDVGCADLTFGLFTEVLEQPPGALLGEEQAGFRLECGVSRGDYRVWWLVASSPFQGQIPNSQAGE